MKLFQKLLHLLAFLAPQLLCIPIRILRIRISRIRIFLNTPKGDRATVGTSSIAGVVVKMDLTFFEFSQLEHFFAQSNGEGSVKVVRLNNLSQLASLAYSTSSPVADSDWNIDPVGHVTFEANSDITHISMPFDPIPTGRVVKWRIRAYPGKF